MANGLVLDNSDYDDDPALGTYKINFLKENGYSDIVSSLIIEVNDYQSVSYAILTVKQKPASSIILGTLSVPLKDILVKIGNYPSFTYVLTDSAGKFSATIDRTIINQVNVSVIDIFGISNGYIPPSNQNLNITADTTNVFLSYTVAKSFIEGYTKDQLGAPIKNVKIEADGPDFNIFIKTDSIGYYKLGVDLGTWYMYLSIPWTNDYLWNNYPTNTVNLSQEGTVRHDFLFVKSNNAISGNVSYNANGIEGIPVYAFSDSIYNFILTSQNGNYSVPVFKPSSGTKLYNVSPSVAPGYYFDSSTVWGIEPPAQNINFVFKKITGGIGGQLQIAKQENP